MRKDRDEYSEIYKIDMTEEWINAAYDENGDTVFCDICGGEMRWHPAKRQWYCRECGQEMSRPVYLNYIGAEPPGADCLTNCRENYPFCKKSCERYLIDPADPMLT